jgi:D-alanyl-lipoteichoic acid acyltransferase DltB (MBOAT superfamily)
VTLDLLAVLLAVLAAFIYAAVLPARFRLWALLLLSILAVYWLQSPLPIRHSDYIFPTATILLSIAVWWLVKPLPDGANGRLEISRDDQVTLLVIVTVMVGMAFNRFLASGFRLTASRPPHPVVVVLAVVGLALLFFLLLWLLRKVVSLKQLLSGGTAAVVLLFVLLKTEPLAVAAASWWRSGTDQDTSLASVVDLSWLGFSYVAFRLIHTLRDRQMGILPALSLREYLTYVIFFPSFIAGPIDRVEHFVGDMRSLLTLNGLLHAEARGVRKRPR